jgi:MoaA/NifB/PqqE/SkfB family radical SAM enzyme
VVEPVEVFEIPMNLIITDQCNRSCPYCFAGKIVAFPQGAKEKGANSISLASVDWYIDYLRRSGEREFKLLGGEPSLHPQLPEIVKMGLKGGLNLTIFTNGLWPETIQSFFRDNTDERVQFIFHLNEPQLQSETENRRQADSLAVAGRRAMVGFNIYRERFDLGFIPEVVDRFALKRQVRLGLASPIVGAGNRFLGPSALREVGRRLVDQLTALESHDVLGSFDCGFPLCMFSETELGRLTLTTVRGFESICGSIIDVGPDLTAWPCFPLAGLFNIYLPDFENFQAVHTYYGKKTAPLRSFGSMDACMNCKYLRRNQCGGGCLARTINAWMEAGDNQLLAKLNAPLRA